MNTTQNGRRTTALRTLGSVFVWSIAVWAPLTAQADYAPKTACSANHFLALAELGNGGRTSSTTHVLDASFGTGAVASHASSTTHVLLGGFHAAADVATSGAPWLSSVEPRFTTMRGGATVTLHGTGLGLGTAPTVTIGGRTATVRSRSRDRITVDVPVQDEPGFRPVTVDVGTGRTELPRGLGALPLVYEENAAASGVPFTLVFRGSPNDQVAWAVGVRRVTPIPIGGWLHGLVLDPGLLFVMPVFSIAAADGVFQISFPAQTYATGIVLAQAVFVSTNPGYAPGAFSNVVQL